MIIITYVTFGNLTPAPSYLFRHCRLTFFSTAEIFPYTHSAAHQLEIVGHRQHMQRIGMYRRQWQVSSTSLVSHILYVTRVSVRALKV